jgi:TP901 family phage tail tape measure protein
MPGEDDNMRMVVETDIDEASANRAADQLAAVFERAMTRAAPGLARTIERALNNDGLADGARRVADNARFVADAMGDIVDSATQAGRQFDGVGDRIQDTAKRMQRLREDTEAFQERVQAARELLVKGGASPDLLRVFDRQLQITQAHLREFDAEADKLLSDPVRLEGLERGLRESNKITFRELGILQTLLRNQNTERRFELNRLNNVEARAAQERLQSTRIAASQRIVAEQNANSRLLAETRVNGQRRLVQERAQARSRVEIVRFTLQQIQALERTLATVFRGTGRVALGAANATASAVARIGNVFRRSNADMNQGLAGALRQRESAIDRSFDRQTRDIRNSVGQQSAIIQRFEAQASTGVAGALSGRSSLGSLIGGGLAVGGGFALFQGLRDGLEVGGDFVQGLAVLQAQLELTEAEMQNVRQQSIELGNDITLPGVSALDAAQAIQIAAKQFASLGDAALPAAQSAARGILQLSRAAGVGAEEAARVVGAAVNVFGIEASEATAVADQVTNAMKNAAGVGFNEFADAFTQSASVVNLFIGPAQEANEALAETGAALAVLARGGIVGSDAGTSLKQFFLQANRGTDDANEQLNKIVSRAGEVGSVFFDAAGGARTLAESVDILRRGTEGLTDQQLTTTLQKLFGSDAARAAGILLQTTEAEFQKLIDANLELGSAADIAAAQNVGLRGALDALSSVIETQQIKTYERYQGVLGEVVLKFADLLNAFFEGEGVFAVVKAGLQGIAIALGGLLAARAAGEALQFLAIGLRAVATPLGIVVTGIAALGAAFSILREVSPGFRRESDLLIESLSGDLGDAVGGLGDRLGAIAAVIRQDVLPRFIELATAALTLIQPAIDRIGDAFDYAARLAGAFVAAASGEGITSDGLFGFVERLGVAVRTLGLSVEGFISTLTGAEIDPIDERTEDRQFRLIILAEQLGAAIRGIGEQAADVVSRIGTIADAIVNLVATGDFGPLRDRIVAQFSSLGNFVIDEIKPQLDAVVGFIGDFLSGGGGLGGIIGTNVRDFLLGPFQEAARELGKFVGNLVTDPRLLEALAQLAALAVLTGANFIIGLGEGVASNAGGLAEVVERYVGEALSAGLRGALSNKFTFASIIAGAIIGSQVLRAWRTAGDRGGKEVAKGFAQSLRQNVSSSSSASQLLTGFFGGAGALERAAEKEARKATEKLRTEQQRAFDILRASGATRNTADSSFIGPLAPIDELERLRVKLGDVGVAGAALRGSFSQALEGLGTVRSGIGEIINGIRFDFQDRGVETIRTGMGQIGGAFRSGIAALRESLRGIAGGLGQALGSSIVAGVGAALSGRALGGAEGGFEAGLGLAGIISSALFAGASVGGGPQGAVVGTIVGGIGLVTAAWQRNRNAADEAAAKVDDYVDILLRFSDVTEALPDLADQISSAFRAESDAVQRLALEAGLSAEGLATLLADGALTSKEAFILVAEGLGESRVELERFAEAAGGLDTGLGRVRAANLSGLSDQLEGLGLTTQDVNELMGLLTGESEALQGALNEAEFERKFNPAAVEATRDATEKLVSEMGTVETQAERTGFALGKAGQLGQTAFADLITTAVNVDTGLAEIPQRVIDIQTAVSNLEQERLTNIQEQIGQVTSKLDEARTAADLARENLTNFLTGGYANSTQEALDSLVLSLPGIGQQIDEALTLTPTFRDAEINQALSQFSNQVSTAVQAAIEDGTIDPTSRASIDAFLAPYETALDELVARGVENGGISQSAADKIRGRIEETIFGGGDAFELLTTAVFDANAEVAVIQEQLDGLNAQLEVKVRFNTDEINAQLRQLGLPEINAPFAPTPGNNFGETTDPRFASNPTFINLEALAQSQADAKTAAEQSAIAARAALDATAPGRIDAGRANVNIENFNVNGATDPLATSREVQLGLGAIAGGAPVPTPGIGAGGGNTRR